MASDYIKNIKLDEKNNKIIVDIADGNVIPLTFREQREIYSDRKSYKEKYATLVSDLISGAVRCYYENNRLGRLECAKSLVNYNTDFVILGPERTYEKYEQAINQVLDENPENDKQEEIPSELDLRYKLETPPKKSFRDIYVTFGLIEQIIDNDKYSIKDRKEMYEELVETALGKSKDGPIFALYNTVNPEIVVTIYPKINRVSNKEDIYLSYYYDIKNLKSNFEKIYESNGMMISYILFDEKRTKMGMYEMEQRFIEDERKQIEKDEDEMIKTTE